MFVGSRGKCIQSKQQHPNILHLSCLKLSLESSDDPLDSLLMGQRVFRRLKPSSRLSFTSVDPEGGEGTSVRLGRVKRL